jgi:chromosome segregation ATPase
MKRALSVTAVIALSLLVFLFVGYAQEDGAAASASTTNADLLNKEIAAMESAFGDLQAFMAELIGEVKGNMGDIDASNAQIDDLRDIVTAISVELKSAEGKIVGLRTDVDALGSSQQELKARVVALEAGLSELSTTVDALSARLSENQSGLSNLTDEFNALIDDYASFKDAFADFQAQVNGDIDALRDSVTSDLSSLHDEFTANISGLSMTIDDLSTRVQSLEDEDVGTFKKKVLDLERSMAALSIRVDNNRAKLEGFDQAIAGLSDGMSGIQDQVLAANQAALADFDARLTALESVDIQPQLDTLYFISIVALLAGVGALIWGFLGN